VKPPPLEYLRAGTLDEAVAALRADEDAKAMAGGQSLIPLLALRLARPTLLVDLADLGLDAVTVSGGSGRELRIGAMVRQRRLEHDPLVAAAAPLLADAVAQVGYPATRNRGTFGGSLAHADPVAELPAVVVALGGRVVAVGPDGTREIAGADLADGFFTTTLAPDELLTEVVIPAASDRSGAAWCEWAPRAHDFAEAGAGVSIDLDDAGACVAVHAAACGIGGGPLALGAVLVDAGVPGARATSPSMLHAVAAATAAACAGAGDDRAELAGLLTARALVLAWERAVDAVPPARAA
jgi:carbon-monoxide dehydrogenase medium subunit